MTCGSHVNKQVTIIMMICVIVTKKCDFLGSKDVVPSPLLPSSYITFDMRG
jgi:hypothetical protein